MNKGPARRLRWRSSTKSSSTFVCQPHYHSFRNKDEGDPMLRLLFWATCLAICTVRADTEIRNFKLPLSPSSIQRTPPSTTDFEVVKSGIQTFNVSDTSPELWLLWTPGSDEEWKSWIARISWPGSVCLLAYTDHNGNGEKLIVDSHLPNSTLICTLPPNPISVVCSYT